MSQTSSKAGSLLRIRMIEEVRNGNLAPATQQHCLWNNRSLARDTRTAPNQVDAEQVRAWVVVLIDRGRAPSSTNSILSGLRFFYQDVLDRCDIIRWLRNRKRPRRLPRHMTETEVKRLLSARSDLRYWTATVLTYAAELRISKTVAVQISDIKADRKLLHVQSGKGGSRTHGAAPRAGDRIPAQLLADSLAMIGNMAVLWQVPEVPIKTGTLHMAFNSARDRAGNDRIEDFHALRHYPG